MERARTRFDRQKRWGHFQQLVLDAETLQGHRRFLQRAVLAAEDLPHEKRAATLAYLD